MDCRYLQDRIDLYLSGAWPAEQAQAAHAHVASCADCAGIVAALSIAPAADADFTAQIVSRTSGPACDRVEESLADGVRTGLLDAHLQGCRRCRQFVEVIHWMDANLPDLAEIPTDARFVEEVLRLTSQPAPAPRLWRALLGLWSEWVQRPGFAVEFAYVVTVVLVMLTATPVSPLRGPAESTLHWLQSDAKAEALPLGFAEAKATQAGEVAEGIRGDLSERGEQFSVVWRRINGHRVELGDALLDADLQRAAPLLRDLGCDAKLLWRSVRKQLPQGEEPSCSDQ